MRANKPRCSRFGLAVAAMVMLSGCSGDVAGTVFVKMRSGDVKRGADVEVVLVSASAQFEAEWKKVVEGYKNAGAAVSEQRDEASAAERRAYQAYLSDVLSPSKKTSWEEASTRVMQLAMHVDQAHNSQRQHALKLIEWAKKGTTRTSVEGRYEFPGVSRGKYYVFARYEDANNVLEWMVPIEVASGSQRVDLTNSNSGQLLR